MFLHAQHDVLKVESGDVAWTVRIFDLESFHRALLVKVMEKLGEFWVVNGASPVVSKIKLRERSIEFEGNFHVKLRLFDDSGKFSYNE